MDFEKQNAFRNLHGRVRILGQDQVAISVNDSLDVINNTVKNKLLLGRKIKINEKFIGVILKENGLRKVVSGYNHLHIKRYVNGYYVVIATDEIIHLFEQKEIIISKEQFRRNLANGFVEYRVKFNNLVRLDFSDVPESLNKFFDEIFSEEPCVMDLD